MAMVFQAVKDEKQDASMVTESFVDGGDMEGILAATPVWRLINNEREAILASSILTVRDLTSNRDVQIVGRPGLLRLHRA